MSFIHFESANEKERIRQELREARELLLQKAKQRAEKCVERDINRELCGEKNWILPAVAKKFKKSKKKESKKKQKPKKKKSGKKRKYSSSSECTESDSDSSSSSSTSEDARSKKKKKKHHKSHAKSSHDSFDGARKEKQKESKGCQKPKESSESSDSCPEKWVEKGKLVDMEVNVQRDSWMTAVDSFKLTTFSRNRNDKKIDEKQHIEAYDPAKSSRELNPHWKSTGTGLPGFQKPIEEGEEAPAKRHGQRLIANPGLDGTKSWQKSKSVKAAVSCGTDKQSNSKTEVSPESSSDSSSYSESRDKEKKVFLTNHEMNELGAQIVKAEILGNTKLAKELQVKLDNARKSRSAMKIDKEKLTNTLEKATKPKYGPEEHVLLTHTDEQGNCRPLPTTSTSRRAIDPRELYGGRKGRKDKPKRIETHLDGERVRYFADDDKYDIKQMFEREKYSSAADSNLQFANIASKHKNSKDDLDDIFSDDIRKHVPTEEIDRKDMKRAINEHHKLSTILENCDRCFESDKMDKKLLISMGEKVYLALPWYVGLQPGHCVIVPTQHANSCTQLDEDTWEEISNFRKALTRMFSAHRKDVIFYEIANKFHKRPHLRIHCVPIPVDSGELAPFYFKKAIEESEHVWSVNKQLVSLRNKGLRSAIPKGLPYFWVNFGMESGFAHVIEDENRFPGSFAQEIIGGMLELDPKKWRKPKKEQNIIAKVKMFADWWKKYDCTS